MLTLDQWDLLQLIPAIHGFVLVLQIELSRYLINWSQNACYSCLLWKDLYIRLKTRRTMLSYWFCGSPLQFNLIQISFFPCMLACELLNLAYTFCQSISLFKFWTTAIFLLNTIYYFSLSCQVCYFSSVQIKALDDFVLSCSFGQILDLASGVLKHTVISRSQWSS